MCWMLPQSLSSPDDLSEEENLSDLSKEESMDSEWEDESVKKRRLPTRKARTIKRVKFGDDEGLSNGELEGSQSDSEDSDDFVKGRKTRGKSTSWKKKSAKSGVELRRETRTSSRTLVKKSYVEEASEEEEGKDRAVGDDVCVPPFALSFLSSIESLLKRGISHRNLRETSWKVSWKETCPPCHKWTLLSASSGISLRELQRPCWQKENLQTL